MVRLFHITRFEVMAILIMSTQRLSEGCHGTTKSQIFATATILSWASR